MSGRSRFKRKRDVRGVEAREAATIRTGRTVGLGLGAGAVLTLGVNTFGLAPAAHADLIGDIFGPIISDVTTVVSDVSTEINTVVIGVESAVNTDVNSLLFELDLPTLSSPVNDDPASVGIQMIANDPVVHIAVDGGPAVPVELDTGSDGLVLPSQDVPQVALWLAALNASNYVHGTFGDATGTITYDGVEVQVPSVTIGEPSSGEVTTGQTDVIAVLSAKDGSGHPETLAQFNDNHVVGILGIGPNQPTSLYDNPLGNGPTGHVPPQTLSVTDALPGDLKYGELLQLNSSGGTVKFGTIQDIIDTAGPTSSTSGAPTTPVWVQIGSNPKTEVDGIFDSGGQYGSVPQSAVGGFTSIGPNTEISVYNTANQLLYQYNTGPDDANAPNVFNAEEDTTGPDKDPSGVPLPDMNTGIAAFEYDANGNTNSAYDGIYITNDPGATLSSNPSEVGSLTFQSPPAPPPPPSGPTVVATIDGFNIPDGVAVSPTGPEAGDIYVTNATYNENAIITSTVSVIDPSTNTIVDNIGVGETPISVAVDPSGLEAGDIYVLNYGSATVSVIDPSTNTLVDTIDLGNQPFDIAVSPTGPEAGDIYITHDLQACYVDVINPSTNTEVASIYTGPTAAGIYFVNSSEAGVAVSPTGPEAGDIYVANTGASLATGETSPTLSVIDPSTNTIAATINLAQTPTEVAVGTTGPEAGDIYLTDGSGTLSLIDPSTNSVVDSVALNNAFSDGLGVPDGLAVSPTGPEAGDIYVTVSDGGNPGSDGELLVIDPSSNTIVNTVDVGEGPGYIAVSPTGPEAGDIYITHPGSDSVTVLKP